MFDLTPFNRRERNLWNNMDDSFNRFMNPFFGMENWGAMGTDVEDKGDHYLLTADLPGFNKKDIHVRIDGDVLTIEAEKKEDKKEERHNYVCRERHYGSYHRSFDLTGILKDQISGNYTDGVLSIKLPKEKTNGTDDQQSIEVNLD
ncbi:Hsp20 family protein [Oscillospiraceae bacterium HV4-5-C5C]|nr:Hsp20 family protein [Oscillospiraceae bacterium HV4-5-C5C]